MHTAILFTVLPFTLSKLNHCPMTLHYYTLKSEIKMTGEENNFYQNASEREEYID